jgi:hypothetical protein
MLQGGKFWSRASPANYRPPESVQLPKGYFTRLANLATRVNTRPTTDSRCQEQRCEEGESKPKGKKGLLP